MRLKKSFIRESEGKGRTSRVGNGCLGELTGISLNSPKKLFEDFKKIPAEIRIDTNRLGSADVHKTVLAKLEGYCLNSDFD